MIVMKKRSSEILQKLILEETTHSIGQYAKLYEVTERTIRADIKEINALFEQLKIPSIKTVEDGLILVDRKTDYSTVLQYIKKMGYYSYKMSPKERQSIILLMLTNKNSYITMSELSESLFVSRLTIMSDIVEIKEQLKPYDLRIISQSRGIRMRFDEMNLRSMIVDMLRYYFENLRSRSIFQDMLLRELAERYSLDVISKSLQKLENLMGVNLSNESFGNLVFYLFVAVNRFSMGNISSHETVSGIEEEEELQLAARIYKGLSTELDISVEKEEIISLARYIKEKNIFPLSSNITDYPEIYVVIANFLFSVQKALEINITRNHDYDLFEFLVFHIKAMAERLQNNKKVQNPLCEQVIAEYSEVYNATKQNIYLIEEYLGCEVEQDEIAFITMHISAAIERHNSRKPQLSIVVTCPGSMASGHLLAAQIEKYFNFDIREIIAADRLLENEKIDEMDIDFIISSVPLPKSRWPTLVVNPILCEEDYNHIQKLAFSLYRNHEEKQGNNLRSSILEEFSKVIGATEQQDLLIFRRELQSFYTKHIANATGKQESPCLHEIIQPNLISTHAHAKNWRSAIKAGGGLLVRNGYVATEYVSAMIENIEKYGPYCVMRKGLALAHAQPQKSVFSTGMSLLVLNDGVEFGHEDNDPVHLLFCFCVNDSRDYLKALNNLIALGNESSFFSEMFAAQNSDCAYKILAQREKNLCKLQEAATL